MTSSARVQEQFEESKVLYERAIKIGERVFGADDLRLVNACMKLSCVLEMEYVRGLATAPFFDNIIG